MKTFLTWNWWKFAGWWLMMHHDSFFIDDPPKWHRILSLQKPWWAGGSQSSKTTHRTHYAWCLWTFENLRWIPICLKKKELQPTLPFCGHFSNDLSTFLNCEFVGAIFTKESIISELFQGKVVSCVSASAWIFYTGMWPWPLANWGWSAFRCGVLHVTRHPGEGWRLGGIVRAQ